MELPNDKEKAEEFLLRKLNSIYQTIELDLSENYGDIQAKGVMQSLMKMQEVQEIAVKVINFCNNFCETNEDFHKVIEFVGSKNLQDVLQDVEISPADTDEINMVTILTGLVRKLIECTVLFFFLTDRFVKPLERFAPCIENDQRVCEGIAIYLDNIKKYEAQCEGYVNELKNLAFTYINGLDEGTMGILMEQGLLTEYEVQGEPCLCMPGIQIDQEPISINQIERFTITHKKHYEYEKQAMYARISQLASQKQAGQ